MAGCSRLTGQRYSQAEVKGLLAQAGWPADLIERMSAIVMAESGGYSCAHNACGEDSWGLGQVYATVHPEYDRSRLCEPIYNLRACYAIYRQQGFRAWGAYTDGRYRQYLGAGGYAVTPAGSGGSAAGSGSGIAAAASSAAGWLPYGILGLVLVVLLIDD